MIKQGHIYKPRYISFDCYGTLTRFRMGDMTVASHSDRISAEDMPRFVRDFANFRRDEVLRDWQPYRELIRNSLRRADEKWGVEHREADADAIYEAVPTWGPHDDVVGGLSKIGDKIPLVILSNAMNDQIMHNVEQLGAPFHRVYTAESARAYKPRLQAFEYMFDQLGCGPEEMMHVSSSFRYDLISASDLDFGCRVFINRGTEPSNADYRDVEIPHIGCLPALVGL